MSTDNSRVGKPREGYKIYRVHIEVTFSQYRDVEAKNEKEAEAIGKNIASEVAFNNTSEYMTDVEVLCEV